MGSGLFYNVAGVFGGAEGLGGYGGSLWVGQGSARVLYVYHSDRCRQRSHVICAELCSQIFVGSGGCLKRL